MIRARTRARAKSRSIGGRPYGTCGMVFGVVLALSSVRLEASVARLPVELLESVWATSCGKRTTRSIRKTSPTGGHPPAREFEFSKSDRVVPLEQRSDGPRRVVVMMTSWGAD